MNCWCPNPNDSRLWSFVSDLMANFPAPASHTMTLKKCVLGAFLCLCLGIALQGRDVFIFRSDPGGQHSEHTRTHTHTHTYTHTHSHTGTHAYPCTHTQPASLKSSPNAYKQTPTHTHAHLHPPTQIHTVIHIQDPLNCTRPY